MRDQCYSLLAPQRRPSSPSAAQVSTQISIRGHTGLRKEGFGAPACKVGSVRDQCTGALFPQPSVFLFACRRPTAQRRKRRRH